MFVTGVRRCGKSTLLMQFIEYLKHEGIKSNQIISVNFEDIENDQYLDYGKLYKYILERLKDNEMSYIFLDEIQNVSNFKRLSIVYQ